MQMPNETFSLRYDEPEPLHLSARIDDSFAIPDEPAPKSSTTFDLNALDITDEFKCKMGNILDNWAKSKETSRKRPYFLNLRNSFIIKTYLLMMSNCTIPYKIILQESNSYCYNHHIQLL